MVPSANLLDVGFSFLCDSGQQTVEDLRLRGSILLILFIWPTK